MNQPAVDYSTLPRARLVGRLIALASFVLFALTLSRVFFPGDSVRLVAEHLGLTPFPPRSHHLWGWCIRLLGELPIGPVAIRVNLFSALCGTLSAWLLYQIVLRIRHDRTFDESMSRFSQSSAQIFSGAVAALMLVTSVPFWMVSTRAHHLSFDVAMGLLAFYLLLRHGETKRMGLLYGAVFLYGLGITEYAALIPVSILFAILVFFYLWRNGRFRWGTILRLFVVGMLGLSPYFIAAALYMRTPAYEWLEYKHYGQVLWYMWREQYAAIAHSLPQVGWLTVGMVSFVPWFIIMGSLGGDGRPRSRGVWMGAPLLYALLGAIAIGLLFNFTLSPWRMTGLRPLLVTPYVFAAMWGSYVAGFWYIRITRIGRTSDQMRTILGVVYGVALLFVIGAAALQNLATSSGRGAGPAARFASEILDSLGSRTWIVTTGEADESLLLAARQKGLKINVINARNAQSRGYSRYVASLFEEPRYRSLAQVGLRPLMTELLQNDPGVADRLAFLNTPDLWLEAGLQPRPSRAVFVGERADSAPDPEQVVADFRTFWLDYGRVVQASMKNPGPLLAATNRRISTHLSKMANNLAVYLEDRGRADLAYEWYVQALEMDASNISAMINRHTLASAQKRDDVAEIEQKLEAIAQQVSSQYEIWALAYYYGYIRTPELYARRGWAWAMSGKPRLAVDDMQRALEMVGTNTMLQMGLAGLYFAQEKNEESRSAYVEILTQNPSNQVAVLGLARTAMRSGDYDSARGYLDRLREMKAPPRVVDLEQAILETLSGQAASAVARLTEMVKSEPEDLRAWAALAAAASQANEERTLQTALDKLQDAKAVSPSVRLTMAQLAWQRKDLVSARKHLEELLRIQPGNITALENILRICVAEGKRDEAEGYVEMLITMDPANAFGNYLLGSLQLYSEQYALAESSFRASLAVRRSPEVLNDLAWLLRRRGAREEAMSLIQESLRMFDRSGAAWDTYASLLLEQNKVDEAEQALQKAITLRPESAAIVLNMALLYEKKGQFKDARRLSEDLLARPTELTREDYERLRDLMKRLRSTS